MWWLHQPISKVYDNYMDMAKLKSHSRLNLSWSQVWILWRAVTSILLNKLPHDLQLLVSCKIGESEWSLDEIVEEEELQACERTVASVMPAVKKQSRELPQLWHCWLKVLLASRFRIVNQGTCPTPVKFSATPIPGSKFCRRLVAALYTFLAVISAHGHISPQSYQPTVISAHGHISPWSYQPTVFGNYARVGAVLSAIRHHAGSLRGVDLRTPWKVRPVGQCATVQSVLLTRCAMSSAPSNPRCPEQAYC